MARQFTDFENQLVALALDSRRDFDEKYIPHSEDEDAKLARHLQDQEWTPQRVFNVEITGEEDDLKTAGLIWKDLVVDEQAKLLDAFDPQAIARAAEESEALAIRLQFGTDANQDASLAVAEQLRLEDLAQRAAADAKYAATLQ